MAATSLVPYVVPALLVLAAGIGWLVALVDVSRRSDHEFPRLWPVEDQRMAWAFTLVVTSALGALLYYALVMRPYPRHRS